MDLELERQVRGNALDLAHNKGRDEYFKALENTYRKVLIELRNEECALVAADGAARRAYVEMHCAVYKETCGKERANFDDDARRSDKAA